MAVHVFTIHPAINVLHVQHAPGNRPRGSYMGEDDTLTIAGTASRPSV